MLIRLVGLLLLLTATAQAADFGWNPDIEAHRRFPAHAGFVAVHVVDNLETQWPGFPGWSGLVVQRTDGPGRSYTLQGVRRSISSGQIFVATLPAGDYVIARLWSGDTGYPERWGFRPKVPIELARFRVEPQRFTDIGTLVYLLGAAFERTNNPLVRSAKYPGRMLRLTARPGLLDWFHANYPKQAKVRPAKRLFDVPSGEFVLADQHPAGATNVLPAIRELAIGGMPRFLDEQRIAVPARLGQLRLRSADGVWGTLDTGFTADLQDALMVENGLLIAGDRGLLARGSVDGRDWTAYRNLPADQVYYWLGRAGDGRVYALGHSHQRATLLRLATNGTDWAEVASFGARQGFRRASEERPGPLLALKGLQQVTSRPIATRPSVLGSDAATMRIAVGSKRWLYRYADGRLLSDGSGPNLVRVDTQRNGVLLANATSDAGVPDYSYSSDRGDSWVRARRPKGTGLPAVLTRASPPYVAADGNVLMLGPKFIRDNQLRLIASSGNYLLGSSDAANPLSWQPLQEMPPGCHSLLSSISSDESIYVECQDQSILRSLDGGKTWHVDRPAPAFPTAASDEAATELESDD